MLPAEPAGVNVRHRARQRRRETFKERVEPLALVRRRRGIERANARIIGRSHLAMGAIEFALEGLLIDPPAKPAHQLGVEPADIGDAPDHARDRLRVARALEIVGEIFPRRIMLDARKLIPAHRACGFRAPPRRRTEGGSPAGKARRNSPSS